MRMISSDSSLPQWEYTRAETSVSILVAGTTYTGKSALINCLVGEYVAPEGYELRPERMVVRPYQIMRNGISITLWDSPGLQGGTGNDALYIADIKEKCRSIDLVFYCVSMTNIRFGEDDYHAMEALTQAFGVEFWENTVVVLTFANCVDLTRRRPDAHKFKQAQFEKTIHEVLKKLQVPTEIAAAVPVVPAGYSNGSDTKVRELPDCTDWLSRLWSISFLRMKESAQPAMLKAAEDRIKKPEGIAVEAAGAHGRVLASIKRYFTGHT